MEKTEQVLNSQPGVFRKKKKTSGIYFLAFLRGVTLQNA